MGSQRSNKYPKVSFATNKKLCSIYEYKTKRLKCDKVLGMNRVKGLSDFRNMMGTCNKSIGSLKNQNSSFS